MIKKILFEPLLHFLLLGFFLYLYYNTTASSQTLEDKKTIKISSYEIGEIESTYKKEWSKDVNENQLQALISKKYYEKILLNEAYSLGLQKQDKVISERLIKQMNFIMTNSSEIIEPTEEELHQYYSKNIDDYSEIKNLSFSHIFFENQKDERVSETLNLIKIADINVTDAPDFGERFKLSNSEEKAHFEELQIIYGKYFALKVFKLKKGLWHKAIESKFGTHIIYITDKDIGVPYLFDEVEDRVYEDYMDEQRERIKEDAYQKITTQYSLEVK